MTQMENKGDKETIFHAKEIKNKISSKGMEDTNNQTETQNKLKTCTIFISYNNLDHNVVLKGDPVNIICQNINFYMGGTKDIWSKSGSSIGLEINNERNVNVKAIEQDKKTLEESLKNAKQSHNDQKLEFFTYSSGFKLGMEKMFTGLADKIYQGTGPYILKFKETPEKV